MRKFLRTHAPAALALSVAGLLAGCGGMATNRMVDSVHQPVVEKTNYALDLTTGPGGLSLPDQRRIAGWFEALDLHYGDKVYVDDPLANAETRAAVEAAVARYGLLLSEGAPVTQGYVNAGSARIVVVRASASVPSCPLWKSDSDTNFASGTSSNYGCAVNSNLAIMVANPEHLVKGAAGSSETTIVVATKAIDAFREKPAKAGEVTATSTKGN